MRKTMRGFTFIEVILYIGLFSLLGTALLTFSWDIIELSKKGQTDRAMTEEGRFALERIKFLLRNASGIDEENSVWDDPDGKLVVNVFGSSETVTIERQNERVILHTSGHDPVILRSQDFKTSILLFERSRDTSQRVSYVDVTLTMETPSLMPQEYTGALTLKTGIFLRNLGL